MAEISMADLAQAAADLVVSRLDEKYDLVYIDRGDRLSDQQVQKLFAGEEEVLDSEWESENKWHGENAVLDNLLDKDARDWLAEHDVLAQVREAIGERDQSDPLGDLMRETGPMLFRYRLDAEAGADPWRYSDQQTEDAARTLGAAAGLDFDDNCEALRELVAHASYGGDLHILWQGEIKPSYEVMCQVRFSDPAPEISVQWTDPELLVLDQINGSGHTVRVRGTVRLPFDPDRLTVDIARSRRGISWTDVVGGGYRPEGDAPEFTKPDAK
ncbi:hypothetical protein [Streptomyces sp. NPDC057002]|uniref:hypothetical protein n=1 Tax=Streptomyces sp. NPDC057002 TaxID=3345992 RepID=UPI0036451A8E